MNIFALTPPDSPYPPYISINETADKAVSLTVRTEAKDGTCGNVGHIVITRAEFMKLLVVSLQWMTRPEQETT
jgi:hypothetical protein